MQTIERGLQVVDFWRYSVKFFILYSPIFSTPCWLYTPHFADLYLYIRVKRPRGCACKNQVKILLWYYVIVESDTDKTR